MWCVIGGRVWWALGGSNRGVGKGRRYVTQGMRKQGMRKQGMTSRPVQQVSKYRQRWFEKHDIVTNLEQLLHDKLCRVPQLVYEPRLVCLAPEMMVCFQQVQPLNTPACTEHASSGSANSPGEPNLTPMPHQAGTHSRTPHIG